MLGRVVKLEPFGQASRLGRVEPFVKRFRAVCVQVVDHNPDYVCLRKLFVQVLHEPCKIEHGALLSDTEMASR